MAIPEEVRNVERPVNTIVVASGNGPLRYAVIERIGCRRTNGRNVPVNGRTVGHIVGGKYVEGRAKVARNVVEIKDFANVSFLDGISGSLLGELYKVYDPADAARIYVMALLKVCYPGLPYCRMQDRYEQSWASELYPGTPLGRNSVSGFLSDLGKGYSRISTFMRNRVCAIAAGCHVAIDGTLLTDTSRVNDLSHFSRKARLKGTKDISILYAYDVIGREPICAKVYAGNIVDQRAYEDFLEENGLKRGILMGDKGFPRSQAGKCFSSNPDLHWLDPIKRSDRRIAAHDLYNYAGMLDDRNRDVLYKKAKADGYFLYSFYDRRRAAKEEADYFRHKKGKEYDAAEMKDRTMKFGTVVFESDFDTDPEVIYRMYDERWLIEQFFLSYKQFTEFDDTEVHSDYSVIGSEFVNFFASVMSSRLVGMFDGTGLSDDHTYGELLDALASAKKAKVKQDGKWELIRTTVTVNGILETLGIIPQKSKPKDTGKPTTKAKEPKRPAKNV
jgi:hypothetical protein